MAEKDAFKVCDQIVQKYLPVANPSENITKNKEPSKHRQKYAKRRENLAKKEIKKPAKVINNKQLESSLAMDVKHTETNNKISLRPSSAKGGYEKNNGELHQTKCTNRDKNYVSINQLSLNDRSQNNEAFISIDSRQKSVNESQNKSTNKCWQTSDTELQRKINLFSENEHSKEDLKDSFGVKSLQNQSKKIPPLNIVSNYDFQHEDNVSYLNTKVFFDDNFGVLPGVLIDSGDEMETGNSIYETVSGSQSNRNSMLSPRNIFNFKTSLENIASKTVLGDDRSFEQRGADGRIRSRSGSVCSNTSLNEL